MVAPEVGDARSFIFCSLLHLQQLVGYVYATVDDVRKESRMSRTTDVDVFRIDVF